MTRHASNHIDWSGVQPARPVAVLTERIASAIVDHEPGWRLPQATALARRYNATIVEIDRAIQELVAAHLLRRMPDGRLCRASPADYLIQLEGIPGISAYIDPMGLSLTCSYRNVSWRQVPDDVGLALGLRPSASCTIIRSQWLADGNRAALSTTYLPHVSGNTIQEAGSDAGSLDEALNHAPAVAAALDGASRPVAAAVQVQVRPPARSVARSLELRPGMPAIIVAVRFVEPSTGSPVALTAAVLRAEMFRVTIESAGSGLQKLETAMSASSVWPEEATT